MPRWLGMSRQTGDARPAQIAIHQQNGTAALSQRQGQIDGRIGFSLHRRWRW